MNQLRSSFLFSARIGLSPPAAIGASPEGFRAIYDVTGGSFEGPKMRGRYLASGADWARIRGDGSLAIDVRCTLETDDGALIYASYLGRLVVPAELQDAVFNLDADERPDPSTYYFRVAPLFETSAPHYAWLNGIQAVGVGETVKGGVAYRVYAID